MTTIYLHERHAYCAHCSPATVTALDLEMTCVTFYHYPQDQRERSSLSF